MDKPLTIAEVEAFAENVASVIPPEYRDRFKEVVHLARANLAGEGNLVAAAVVGPDNVPKTEDTSLKASAPHTLPAKIIVRFERRHDGGLRAWSDDVPGFLLSHKDCDAVLKDVIPALEGILSDLCGTPIVVQPLPRLREDEAPLVPDDLHDSVQREYVTLPSTP
jgi:hypothetical protein